MARKQTPSSIDRLPRELRELIGELRRDGRTIDEILEKLRELDANVSRSALGRHVKSLGEIAERMQRSRQMAEALVNKFGDQPDNKLARINLELMHTVVMETITAAEVDPETGEARSITFSPEQAMFLARAMQSLASAEKANDDRITKARDRERKEAAEKAGAAAKSKGLSADTVDFIRQAVLGTA
ncbi:MULTISPECIES: phage protein Gp27 family protein [unclassified Sphingomonas]|uniref:phage protein Gp27 family protein n=1 Tax=unclassified Sphingomonas TaxID=196159 RepID=UPI000833B308|nr:MULTISPECIES: phage protein Gp27 family protein [unclassified Sphingomonas]